MLSRESENIMGYYDQTDPIERTLFLECAQSADPEECTFEGDIDVQIVNADFEWTCPKCGESRTGEYIDEPDADFLNDLARDR